MHGNGPYKIICIFTQKSTGKEKSFNCFNYNFICLICFDVLWQQISNAVKKIHTAVIILHIQQVFDVHVTVHRVKFLIVKPVSCTNFSNYFLETLHVSDISSVHHQEFFTVHKAMIYYVIQVCGQLASRIRMFHPDPTQKLSAILYDIYIAVCTVKTPWWWTEEMSETCRVSKKNFEKLVHVAGFIIRNSASGYFCVPKCSQYHTWNVILKRVFTVS
jgi:hypothetical protein